MLLSSQAKRRSAKAAAIIRSAGNATFVAKRIFTTLKYSKALYFARAAPNGFFKVVIPQEDPKISLEERRDLSRFPRNSKSAKPLPTPSIKNDVSKVDLAHNYIVPMLNNLNNFFQAYNVKRNSVEMGTTTDVTQELLKQMNYPILDREEHAAPAKPNKKHKKKKKSSADLQVLRIAELGASTEIAHIALRQRSSAPIFIASE
ncbi:unnamed protein product [Leptosia nina]|uniref:Uncharacterized protein n=1 Tax=Leptosia nina TaxID=320188 RepID=A0AAV1JBX4_9NEOP